MSQVRLVHRRPDGVSLDPWGTVVLPSPGASVQVDDLPPKVWRTLSRLEKTEAFPAGAGYQNQMVADRAVTASERVDGSPSDRFRLPPSLVLVLAIATLMSGLVVLAVAAAHQIGQFLAVLIADPPLTVAVLTVSSVLFLSVLAAVFVARGGSRSDGLSYPSRM